MTVTVAGLPFDFIQASSAAGMTGFFFKSTKDAYYYNVLTATLTKVTDPDYPATTVPGVVYLDGTYYVMDSTGKIWGSDLEAPTSWNALNFINANMTSDNPVALTGYRNFVISFMTKTTSFFYDAGNPTGSPLLPYTSAEINVGCASAGSVARSDDTVFWMGVTTQTGRSIYMFEGTSARPVSTPFIDKILNKDSLATVRSWCIRTQGHRLYVLTLENTAVTLVYDTTTGLWSDWTSLTPTTGKSVTSLTYANGTVTASCTGHGLGDGDPTIIAGATPSGYNGTVNSSYVDANTFTYKVSSALTSPATGTITSTGWTSSYFGGTFYTSIQSLDVIQFESTGNTYSMDPAVFNDFGNPIDAKVRTANWDGGDNKHKFCSSTQVIGDKVSSTAYIRYTNDDYQTFSAYRPVNLSWGRSIVARCGTFRRRAWEIRHTDSTAFRVEALEHEIDKGTN